MQSRSSKDIQKDGPILSIARDHLRKLALAEVKEQPLHVQWPESRLFSVSNLIERLKSSPESKWAEVSVQEASIPLECGNSEGRLLVKSLNHFFKQAPAWKNVKEKNTIAYDFSRGDNPQIIVPIKDLENHFGFSIAKGPVAKGRMPVLMLRIPDAIHLVAATDVGMYLQAIGEQLDSGKKEIAVERR